MNNLDKPTSILRNAALVGMPYSLSVPISGAINKQLPQQQMVQVMSPVEMSEESCFNAAKEAGFEEGRQEGKNAGFTAGYEEGYQQGLAAAMQEVEEKLHKQMAENKALIDKLQQQMRQQFVKRLNAIEDDAIEIIFAVTMKILGESAHTASGIKQLAQQTMSEIRHRPILTIRLHPDDYALLSSDRSLSLDTRAVDRFVWQADAEISIGGCIVETEHGALDARLETQIGLLKESLLQVRAARKLELQA